MEAVIEWHQRLAVIRQERFALERGIRSGESDFEVIAFRRRASLTGAAFEFIPVDS